jgi:hypothetical protein
LLGHDGQHIQVLSGLDLTAIDKWIQENLCAADLCAADVHLTDEELERIEAELAKIETHGNRTDEDIAKVAQQDHFRISRAAPGQAYQAACLKSERRCSRRKSGPPEMLRCFWQVTPAKILCIHELVTDITHRHLFFIQPGNVTATGS